MSTSHVYDVTSISRGGWCGVGFTDKEAVKQETTAQD